MAIKQRNPEASMNNALKLEGADGICCGDETPVTVNDYTLALNTGSVATATSIRIAGVTYAFAATYSTTTSQGRRDICDAIAAQLNALGYTKVRVTVSFSSPTATFVVHRSQVVITGLNNSGNAFSAGANQQYGILN